MALNDKQKARVESIQECINCARFFGCQYKKVKPEKCLNFEERKKDGK